MARAPVAAHKRVRGEGGQTRTRVVMGTRASPGGERERGECLRGCARGGGGGGGGGGAGEPPPSGARGAIEGGRKPPSHSADSFAELSKSAVSELALVPRDLAVSPRDSSSPISHEDRIP